MSLIAPLLELIHGRALYLRLPGFLCEDACRLAAGRILDGAASGQAASTTGLTHRQLLRLLGEGLPGADDDSSRDKGLSYYSALHDAADGWRKAPDGGGLDAYYALAAQAEALTRRLFAPHASPLDKLRCELDRVWPPGSAALDLGQGAMFSGLLRVLSDEVLAHEDKLERDHGHLPEQLGYVTQFAVNTYIQTPRLGGELKLWDRSLGDVEYDALRGATYGIAHGVLGAPDACIAPAAGDVIIFNSRKLHGVGKSEGGKRVSMSSFMAYSGIDKPLYFWS